ncbi:MAG: GatB/YqeY domain-containing protein [Saprospiraceae bacterium]|nr:GatB/YqeY domain-containing protein [Candidatus Vicinibacter affinis]MBP6171986.1 GatB/YqeY domain-containing protein [Saprospiraceae bacterium]MBK6573153.1 GatB/YqeY domain-containing protein [Candidatus Vicinibacter affinis]MBK6822383.1 GatB/YqeY domain-containing protein [Candidatus Vicinibacter affinis]MBK7301835.1 GatB/YqeY domain-containing protein [Candidatus Vicinibacter affinis]
MGFQDRINQDLKEAMKAKNENSLRAIRAIKAAILLANTDGSGQEMTEERGIQILQKLVKQRKESLEIYEKQGREDLAAIERQEIQVLIKYLPEQMSEEELRSTILTLIQDLGATSAGDLGRVMGVASKQLAGKADGKSISSIVKDLLSKG